MKIIFSICLLLSCTYALYGANVPEQAEKEMTLEDISPAVLDGSVLRTPLDIKIFIFKKEIDSVAQYKKVKRTYRLQSSSDPDFKIIKKLFESPDCHFEISRGKSWGAEEGVDYSDEYMVKNNVVLYRVRFHPIKDGELAVTLGRINGLSYSGETYYFSRKDDYWQVNNHKIDIHST